MEKRYEEALERARNGMPINEIFPELKESEDERIRKNCIHFLGLQKAHHADTSEIDECISYLEKQKEQKPAQFKGESLAEIIKGEFEGFRSLLKKKGIDYEPQSAYWESLARLFDSSAREYLKEQKPEIKYVYPIFKVGDTIKPKAYNESHRINKIKDDNYVLDNGFTFPIVGQDVWEIVEQEPAEWSEEDKSILNNIVAYKVLNIDDLEWLKSLPERFNFQPKQEWSERDKKIINEIITIMDGGRVTSGTYLSEYVAWLKSLRPQPQHKDTYYDIIHNILDMLKDMDFTQITPEHRVSLLNDIRVKCKNADECAAILDEPHWKPSGEQMEILQYLCEHSSHANPDVMPTLESLYHDLQKLL